MTTLRAKLRLNQKMLLPYLNLAEQEVRADYIDDDERDRERSEQLDSLMSDPSIKSFLREYPREANVVQSQLNELLQGAEFVPARLNAEILTEHELLDAFQDESTERLIDGWTRSNRYHKHLEATYNDSEVPLSKYDREAARLRKEDIKENSEQSERWKEKIIRDWETALAARKRILRREQEKASHERILEEMKFRISQFYRLSQLLGPIQQYLAFSWDLSSSNLQESFFDIVERSDKLMENKKMITAIANRLGRLQEKEREYSEQTLKQFIRPDRWIPQHAAKSSVIGIRESDDISSIISSEALLLALPETEILFYLKFAEKKLLTYDYQPEKEWESIVSPRHKHRTPILEKGPVIIAVDTSASMAGEFEKDAKALALSLTRIALSQHRPVHLITFSERSESLTILPSDNKSLHTIIQFLLMSFHGGTDPATALAQGLKVLEESSFRDADMVFITDGKAAPFNPANVTAMNVARERGVKFYGWLVGDQANKKLLTQFDYNWRYNSHQLTDIAINLEEYRRQSFAPV